MCLEKIFRSHLWCFLFKSFFCFFNKLNKIFSCMLSYQYMTYLHKCQVKIYLNWKFLQFISNFKIYYKNSCNVSTYVLNFLVWSSRAERLQGNVELILFIVHVDALLQRIGCWLGFGFTKNSVDNCNHMVYNGAQEVKIRVR